MMYHFFPGDEPVDVSVMTFSPSISSFCLKLTETVKEPLNKYLEHRID